MPLDDAERATLLSRIVRIQELFEDLQEARSVLERERLGERLRDEVESGPTKDAQ